MPRLTDHWKILGAASAAALAIGVVAGPAVAAGEESAAVSYTCNTQLGPATPAATYVVNAPPATAVAGQVVKLPTTASFTLDKATTDLAKAGLGWVSMDGTISTTPAASGAGLKLTLARTVLGNNADGSTTAVTTGSTLLRAFKAGTYTAKLGNLGSVALKGYDASNAPLGEVDFPNADGTISQCKNNAGSTPIADTTGTAATMTVSKDKTTTGVKAAYSAAKHAAKATAKVKAHFGLKPTGKVTFVLKKGAKTVATVKAKVNKKGQAKAAFKVAKKGAYKVKASYAGDKALKPSNGTAKFTA